MQFLTDLILPLSGVFEFTIKSHNHHQDIKDTYQTSSLPNSHNNLLFTIMNMIRDKRTEKKQLKSGRGSKDMDKNKLSHVINV